MAGILCYRPNCNQYARVCRHTSTIELYLPVGPVLMEIYRWTTSVYQAYYKVRLSLGVFTRDIRLSSLGQRRCGDYQCVYCSVGL